MANGRARDSQTRSQPMNFQADRIRARYETNPLADEIEKPAAAAVARADRLTQAILAKAFRGELVSAEAELARREGRGFESAGELLEGIREVSSHA